MPTRARDSDSLPLDASGLSEAQQRLLSSRLAQLRTTAAQTSDEIPRRDPSSPPRLSPAQQGLLVLDQLAGGTNAYNVGQAMRLRGRLDADALQRALDELLRRHEVLRTRFVMDAAGGRPEVQPPGPADLSVVDVEDGDVDRFVKAEVSRGLDLSAGEMCRARVGRVGADDYVLVLVFHHIATDATSKQILNRELSTLYAAYTQGLPSPLPEPGLQYADYAAWLAESDIAADLDWWRSHLTGAPEQTDLPLDRPRGLQETSYGGARFVVDLDADLAGRIREFGGAHRATTYMVLLAAWAALVERYAGQGDVVVGSPVSGRHRPELSDVVGIFLDVLPVRVDTSERPGFGDLVERTRESVTDGLRHQNVSIEKLAEVLKPTRVPGRSPFYQTMLTYKTGRTLVPEFGGLQVDPIPYDGGWSKYDVLIIGYPAGDQIRVMWEYSTELFDEVTVRRMADQFTLLLAAGISEPDRPLTDIQLTTPADEEALAAWTSPQMPTADPFLDMVAAQVELTPDAAAVADASGSITYRQLDQRANQLAHHLISLGVGRDVRVGICMERSVDLEVAILGVLKAGGAYVPLDPSYPADRLSFMLDDSDAKVMLTQSWLVGSAPHHEQTTLMDLFDGQDQPVTAPDIQISASQLAYVIYTSGTTGRPKGAMVEHAAVANQLGWMRDNLGIDASDTILQKTPYSFDVSGWELLLAPITGARLFMAEHDRHGDPWYIADVVEAERVTVLNFVPSLMRAFLSAGVTDRCSSVRMLIACGEALPDDVKDGALRAMPGVRVENIYGPVETTIGVTRDACVAERPVTIGHPMGNCTLLVLDEKLRQVPPGMPGEIWIGGVQLARGYVNRPDLTAEKFRDTEFGRLYRTGDRGVWRTDGRLQYLGRLDDQVKLRGFRVELGEIEAVLASHTDVAEACAAIVASPSGEPTLAAYVVVRDDAVTGLLEAGDDDGGSDAQVADWSSVWSETYEHTDAADPFFDTSGWVSSFTAERYPESEMRQWVEATVARTAELAAGRPVLEVGAGSGLLLWRLAPGLAHYVATDLSESAVDRLRSLLGQTGLEATVDVLPLAAGLISPASVGEHLPPGGFGTAVVNSVMQYFPDRLYAADVVRRLREVVAPDGAIFLGDIRDLRVHELFAFRVENSLRQRRTGASQPSPAELKLRLQDRQLLDAELLFTPDFFLDHAGDRHVQVMPRRGRAATEMNDFRYDIVLTSSAPREVEQWADWQDIGTIAALEGRLADVAAAARTAEPGGAALGVKGIPNSRLSPDRAGLADLTQGRMPADSPDVSGVHPDELWELAERLGLHVELSVLEDPYTVAAAFSTDPGPVRFPSAPASSGADSSEPARARALVRLRAQTVRTATELAREKLPDYMVPAAVRVLPSLPMTPSGKLDRKSLPAPTFVPRTGTLPTTPLEQDVARIWSDLLQIETPHLEDDFFDLGGHSLLAIRLTILLAEALGTRVGLRTVFEHPTLQALVAALPLDTEAASGPVPVPRDGRWLAADDLHRRGVVAAALAGTAEPSSGDLVVWPMSATQQRMYVLHKIAPDSPQYNVTLLRRLIGPVDPHALESAVARLAERHELLRTTYRQVDDLLVQVVHPPGGSGPAFALTDARDVATHQVQTMVTRDAEAPFDLASGPVMRVTLTRVADEEWLLLIAAHHICIDGWSTARILSELAELYSGHELAPVHLQFGDYALWAAEHEETDTEAQEFWSRTLQDAPAETTFPTVHSTTLETRPEGRRVRRTLSVELAKRVDELAREQHSSSFAVLTAAVTALLNRYGAGPDVVVGTPMATRSFAGADEILGALLNTLPLRVAVDENAGFDQHVRTVSSVSRAALSHGSYPFERLVSELDVSRDARHPVFQVLVTEQQAPAGTDISFGAATVVPAGVERAITQFDASFRWTRVADRLELAVDYRDDLFGSLVGGHLAERFEVLLSAALEDPSTPLSALELTTPADKSLLASWNDTTDPEAPVACVHSMIEEQVRRTPDAPAVGDADGWLTFAELDARANRLAHHLIGLGVGPDSRVAVCLPRSTRLEVALLAVHKAGGAYVPLDPDYPAERVAFMLEDSGAVALLTESHLAATVPVIEQTVMVDLVDTDDLPSEAPKTDVGPDNLAVIIYTSGSTGLPKGVMMEHRNLSNQLWRTQHYYDLGPADTILQRSPYSFDFSCWELLLAPITGARLFMAETGRHGDPWYLAEVIEAENVTMMNVVPSMLRAFLDSGVTGRCSSLRIVNAGGERLPDDVKDECLRLLPGVWLENVYGPTETTVTVTSDPCSTDRSVTIGRLETNCRGYVLDLHGQLVPPGMPGELWIGGAQVSRGYLDRPELTAERFVETEFGRLYRTGDRVAWKDDGRLDYLGRFDDQVKLRGFRIELGEIEAVLASHPDVASACAAIVPSSSGNDTLAAFVVPRDEATLTDTSRVVDLTAELDTLSRGRLPSHMVPRAVAVVSDLPLTGSGKLDRRAIARLDLSSPAAARHHIAPANETEERLARIWADELSISEPISSDASYFDLGGTSLLALRVFPVIEREFKVKLALSMLFENVTIASLAEVIDASRGSQNPLDPLYTVQPLGDRAPLFALPAARGDALTYLQIAPHLDRDRPLHVVQARGLDGRAAPRTRLEDVALDALEVIRRVQPHGPYHLLGFCFGGVVAYDVAQRLREAGEEIGLVCVVEAGPFGRRLPSSTGGRTTGRTEVGRLRRAMRWRKRGLRWMTSRVPTRLRQYRNLYIQLTLGRLGIEVPRRYVDMVQASRLAASRYVARDSDLHVTLLRASSGNPERDELQRARWESVTTAGCEMHIVEGGPVDHLEVIKGDFAPRVAAYVNQSLARLP